MSGCSFISHWHDITLPFSLSHDKVLAIHIHLCGRRGKMFSLTLISYDLCNFYLSEYSHSLVLQNIWSILQMFSHKTVHLATQGQCTTLPCTSVKNIAIQPPVMPSTIVADSLSTSRSMSGRSLTMTHWRTTSSLVHKQELPSRWETSCRSGLFILHLLTGLF